MFGANRLEFKPAQINRDGYYTAVVIATYGATNGLMLKVFADNGEETVVETDDYLTAVAL